MFFMNLLRPFRVLDHVDQHGYDQYKSRDNLLPVCLQSDKRQTGLQQRHDEYTKQCADDGSIPSVHGSSADNRACNRIQLQAGSGSRCDCLEGRRISNSRQSGKQTGDQIGERLPFCFISLIFMIPIIVLASVNSPFIHFSNAFSSGIL